MPTLPVPVIRNSMLSPAVDIDNLSHSYGDRKALELVNLSVPKGALYGILGPNGGGKTTLFRILSTLIRPSRGTARIFDVDVVLHPSSIRRKVGIVFQSVALDDELTVRENLHAHAALYGIRGAELRSRLDLLLPLFGLNQRSSDRVDRLSGGLKRRVDLVRGLLHAPAVLLLDEPTAGLDPAARRAFWDIVDRLRRREMMTILLATHGMEEADRCDALAILDGGRVVASGTPGDLKQAVGDETVWIECADPPVLASRIKERLDVDVAVIGGRVQISEPNAHALLSSLYDSFGRAIDSATVRRPTLEDVFMVHAGRGIEEADLDLEVQEQR